MSRKVVYLQKEGTLESFCVFEGDILSERTDMTEVTETEHKLLIKRRAEIGEANRKAKLEGFKDATEKENSDKREKAADKEAKEVKKAKAAKKVTAPKAKAIPEEKPVVSENPVVAKPKAKAKPAVKKAKAKGKKKSK